MRFFRLQNQPMTADDCHDRHWSCWGGGSDPTDSAQSRILGRDLTLEMATALVDSADFDESRDAADWLKTRAPRRGMSCFRHKLDLWQYARENQWSGSWFCEFDGELVGAGHDDEDLAHPTRVVRCVRL